MNRILLVGLLATCFGANAQKKLIGTNFVEYDQTGAVQYIDSNEFIYNSWQGSLLSNEPTFEFDGTVFDWTYNLPAIKWDVQKNYNGTVQPLNLTETFDNTFVNGNATVSQSLYQRIEYMYDGSGNITNEKYYYSNGTSYDLSYETTFEFDGNNNKILQQSFNYINGVPEMESIDSLFYNASNQLNRYVHYAFNFTTSSMQISSESLITYAGSEVSNLQLHQETSPGVFEWAFDIYYTYTSGKPTSIVGYEVVAGVPQTIPSVELDFTYGTNGKLAQYEVTFGGTLIQDDIYSYDAQNFISEIDQNSFDFTSAMMYLSNTQKFYYQSTVGIDEVEMTEASVFPNPATDVISISTESDIQSVAIYSANGALMLTQTSGDIAISNLPSGVYIAKVKTSTGVAQARFVKQ